jgi:hypothetical protein
MFDPAAVALRAKREGLLLLALLIASSQRGLAQTQHDLELRLQTSAVDYVRAKAVYDSARSRADARSGLRDTVRAGVLRVLTTPALEPAVRQAAEAASRDVEAIAGRAANSLQTELFFVRTSDKTDVQGHGATWMVTGLRLPDGNDSYTAWADSSAADLHERLRGLAIGRLDGALDARFRSWYGSTGIPIDTMTPVAWANARLQMISSDLTVAQECYDGSMKACNVMLGFTPVSDAVLEWYNVAGRRHVVQLEAYRDGKFATAGMKSCLAGNDEECIRVIRARHLGGWGAGVGRGALLRQAFAMGGHGAIERLLLTNGTPAERIAAAAHAPIDSVVAAWRHNVHDSRVPSDNMSPSMALMSAAWICACAALALRSSRWR